MRGHGFCAVGPNVPVAMYRAVYTESNAAIQQKAIALGGTVTYLDPDEAALADAVHVDVVDAPVGAVEVEGADRRGAATASTPARSASDEGRTLGNHDAARCGDRLQARGDVDAIAVDVAVRLLDHVAEVHADAKSHPAILGHARRADAARSRWTSSAAATAPAAVSKSASTESPAVLTMRPPFDVDALAENGARRVELRAPSRARRASINRE